MDQDRSAEAASDDVDTPVRPWTRPWRVVRTAAGTAFSNRLTGLAGEAAFFAILSLPPLIFGLAGAVGFIAGTIGVDTVSNFRAQVIRLAEIALTGDTVQAVIAPTLDEVLGTGRADIISVGFVISLWAGSRSMNVFIDAISIMYGQGGIRGLVRTRLLSIVVYLVFLLIGVVVMPLILAGPRFIRVLVPGSAGIVSLLYWPVVLIGSACLLATVYHLSLPVRARWWTEIPGAVLTLVIWIAGSWGLRTVLTQSASTASIYGPLAAPIALLLWLYLAAFAILVGAATNAAIDAEWPHLSGRASKLRDAISPVEI